MTEPRPHAYGTDVIEAMLLPRVPELCARLAPDGVRVGHEWQARNPRRADDRRGSFSINLHTGRWADFAGTEASSKEFPCLSLIAYLATPGGTDREAFIAAIKWAKDYLGLSGRAPDPVKLALVSREADEKRTQRQIEDAAAAERKRRAAQAIWLGGQDLNGDDPASEYLRGRGIDVARLAAIPGCLKFNPAVKVATLTGKAHPAMVAAMHREGAPGGFAAVHVTYIAPHDQGWRKAFGKASKKMLGAPSGATIRLTRGRSNKPLAQAPNGEWVAVAEGIENALSAAIVRPDLRILAAATLGNIGKVMLPAQVGGVYVIADNDRAGSQAETALENACNALVDRHIDVKVVRAPAGFKDFNDALMRVIENERLPQNDNAPVTP